jgi:hypothetical protein
MQESKIILDGVDYPLEQFSDNVKRLIGVRQVWQNQLEEERLNVAKSEAAIQSLDAQLTNLVKAELEQLGDVKA